MTERVHRLVESLREKAEPVDIAFNEAYWQSQIEATPENDARRAELEMRLREILGDTEAFRQVEEALASEIHEPLLKRELELWRLALLGNQMTEDERRGIVELSTAVESDFASYRAEVDGERYNDNAILEILKSSDDSDFRRAVWQGSKQVGSVVADRVRELARVRNSAARRLGFADYYRMDLELQELSEDWLFDILGDVERLTEEPFTRWKGELDAHLSEVFGTKEIYPWHYADPFFQELPPGGGISLDDLFTDQDPVKLAEGTFARFGLDVTSVHEKSDLYPRERKCQHAFCIDVDRKGDVRILANVEPNERWTETMLHESGHAAYDLGIDHRLPYTLRRWTHIFVTEAIAQFFGRMTRDPEWLKWGPGFSADAIDPIAEDLRRSLAAQLMVFARWVLVMVHFERDLYSDPEGDLDARWWEYTERYQGLRNPGVAAPEGAWASKIHIACAPVYYHNYLLGDLLAAQLADAAREEHGAVLSDATGRMLGWRIFRPGASLTWAEVVERATGMPLAAESFANLME